MKEKIVITVDVEGAFELKAVMPENEDYGAALEAAYDSLSIEEKAAALDQLVKQVYDVTNAKGETLYGC